jgi:hypothetical protein
MEQRERHRPVEFIDAHRDEYGAEPICAGHQIAPSSYYKVHIPRILSPSVVIDPPILRNQERHVFTVRASALP